MTTVIVPMMSRERELHLANMGSLSSNMVELPYKGERIVMQILLPKERGGLKELEKKINGKNIQDMFQEKKF